MAPLEQDNSIDPVESQVKYGKLEQKVIDEMWKEMDDFNAQIEERQNWTRNGLKAYRERMSANLAKAQKDYIEDLKNDSSKQKESDVDPLIREKTLQENLEIMTHCAQQLDKEHRRLKKQEQWLKIQYSSQEEDYGILMK